MTDAPERLSTAADTLASFVSVTSETVPATDIKSRPAEMPQRLLAAVHLPASSAQDENPIDVPPAALIPLPAAVWTGVAGLGFVAAFKKRRRRG